MKSILSSIARALRHIMLMLGSLLCVGGCAQAGKPAQYTAGSSTSLLKKDIGSSGGVIEITKTGTPVDGIRIEFPAGAVDKNVTIEVSREAGSLRLPSGDNSGAFLRIQAGSIRQFSKPIELKVKFDPELMKKRMIAGYAIQANGRLASVSLKSFDREKGTATFSTMVPLFFTWVHFPRN